MVDITGDVELASALAPKTDQLNVDNFVGIPSIVVTIVGPITIDSTRKISIAVKETKLYRPSVGMGRVLGTVYGVRDNWIGKKIRLFVDESVTFGKSKPGGIRISQLSDITKSISIPLTVSRGRKIMWVVDPLKVEVDEVCLVMVAFRQAKTMVEVEAAVESAKHFSVSQKTRLADDYNRAITRVKDGK